MLTYSEMLSLSSEVAIKLEGSRYRQTCIVDDHTVILFFSEGALLIGLRLPRLRFHLTEKRFQRRTSPCTEQLDGALREARLLKVGLLGKDRILELRFEGGSRVIAEFIPGRPSLFLVDGEGNIVASLFPKKADRYEPPAAPSIGAAESSPLRSADAESRFQFQELQAQLERHLRSQLKRCRKRIEKLENELSRALGFERLQEEGNLLKAHFHLLKRGLETVTVQDWHAGAERELSIDPRLSPEENVARTFKQARSLRKAIPYLQRLLQESRDLMRLRREQLERCTSANSLEVLESLRDPCAFKKETRREKRVRLPYREFRSQAGVAIWVGRSGKDNETLTFSLARGNDLWTHVRDEAGSHVVVRGAADDESVQDALQLALHFSKARGRPSADVCITQVKFVSRLKGASTGRVSLSKHRVAHVAVDSTRVSRLLQANPPPQEEAL